MARNVNTELVVHGTIVDSTNEYNVAMALAQLGLDFEFQYYFGLARVKGSQIIDFLVKTVPKPTPLNVHGTYWHTGRYAAEEQVKMAAVNHRMRGIWAEMVIVWENETETIEDAIEAVRKALVV